MPAVFDPIVIDGVKVRVSPEFARMGWTTADWLTLSSRCLSLRGWLQFPPETFHQNVSPGLALELDTLYGARAPMVLNALAAGASTRFVATILGDRPQPIPASPQVVWRWAQRAGLDEPGACGWAHTDLLNRKSSSPVTEKRAMLALIPQWVDRFGPKAYLWVLAGFTLAEATAMQEAETVVTEDQLRVMAALNGVSLPAGI
ncbi:MAG: hypothetical protein ACOH1Y_17925 [Propionicimonas sp.]